MHLRFDWNGSNWVWLLSFPVSVVQLLTMLPFTHHVTPADFGGSLQNLFILLGFIKAVVYFRNASTASFPKWIRNVQMLFLSSLFCASAVVSFLSEAVNYSCCFCEILGLGQFSGDGRKAAERMAGSYTYFRVESSGWMTLDMPYWLTVKRASTAANKSCFWGYCIRPGVYFSFLDSFGCIKILIVWGNSYLFFQSLSSTFFVFTLPAFSIRGTATIGKTRFTPKKNYFHVFL